MASNRPEPSFLSVVITVRNEERHLRRLLESLLPQEAPFEVVLVDALSHDRTFEIAQEFAHAHPQRVRAFQHPGSRGIGRNAGAIAARGEHVVFIDGDCFADSQWLAALREGVAGPTTVVAGRTVAVGNAPYAALERVELFQQGNDVTYPSCNLLYPRALFDRLGGFDPRFITAEDIDLNLRAVRLGAEIRYLPGAIVYHHMRSSFVRFLYQAFWNGYGRKQLTEKYGALWGNYRYRRLFENTRSALAWARLAAALLGYFTRVVTGGARRLTATVVPAALRRGDPSDR